jgi:hypothetical protein
LHAGDSTAAAELGCLYCPDGAVCPGAGVLPYPLPGYYSDPVLARESGWFVSCGSNSAMCVGGEGFACSNNTRGDRCAQCAEDHFRIGGLCYECPGALPAVWLAEPRVIRKRHSATQVGRFGLCA